jgi:hypothetical protein
MTKHTVVSIIKSLLRLLAFIILILAINLQLVGLSIPAVAFLIGAEILGILEEIG